MQSSDAQNDANNNPINSTQSCWYSTHTIRWETDDLTSSGTNLITFESFDSMLSLFWTLMGFGIVITSIGLLLLVCTCFKYCYDEILEPRISEWLIQRKRLKMAHNMCKEYGTIELYTK